MPRISRRRVLSTTGAAIAGLGLAGCSGDGGGTSNGDQDPIKIGSANPVSGPYARIGRQSVWGHEYAVDQINDEGGINGREVEFMNRDSQLDPQTAVSVTNELIRSENVDIMVGALSSSATAAIQPVCEENNVVLLNVGSAAVSLTGSDCTRTFFRFRHHEGQASRALSPWLYENHGQSMYIMYADYAWGQSARDYFGQEFENAGGEVLGSTGAPTGTGDFSSYLSEIPDDTDILFGAFAGSDAIAWMRQTTEFGYAEDTVRAGPSGLMAVHWNATEGLRDNLKIITDYPANPVGPWDTEQVNTFFDEFNTRFGEDPVYHSGLGYSSDLAWARVARDMDYAGRDENDELISNLENLEVTEDDPTAGMVGKMRSEDHQFAMRQMMADVTDEYSDIEIVPQSVADSISAEDCQL